MARSEANDNGLSRVDRATRRRFPEDLPNLTLTAASMNRHRKRDHANDDGVICNRHRKRDHANDDGVICEER